MHEDGFSLVELLVTICILAIAAGLGWPSFQSVIRSNRLSTANNELITTIAYARSEAMRSRNGAGVCASDDGVRCNGAWQDGWMVWADEDGDGEKDSAETVLRYSKINGHVEIDATTSTGNDLIFSFDGTGRVRDNGARTLTIRPIQCKPGMDERQITVLASGQTRGLRESCV